MHLYVSFAAIFPVCCICILCGSVELRQYRSFHIRKLNEREKKDSHTQLSQISMETEEEIIKSIAATYNIYFAFTSFHIIICALPVFDEKHAVMIFHYRYVLADEPLSFHHQIFKLIRSICQFQCGKTCKICYFIINFLGVYVWCRCNAILWMVGNSI